MKHPVRVTPFFAIALLLGLAAVGEEVPIAQDAGDSQALLRKWRKAEAVLLSDLASEDKGTVFDGETAEALPAGRYRLHAVLAFAPLGSIVNSTVEILIQAGGAGRKVTSLHFPAADEFVDMPLDVALPASGVVPVTISWAFEGKEAKEARTKAVGQNAPKVEATSTDIENAPEDEDDLLHAEMKGGRVPLGDARKIPHRLMLAGLHLEPLSPVAVEQVRSGKVLYRPGEKGTAAVSLRNLGKQMERVTLTVELLFGLDDLKTIHTESFDLPAGESRAWQGEFDTAGLSWGCELRGSTKTESGWYSSASEVFSVAADPWDVALISAHPGHMAHFTQKKDAVAAAEKLRREGFTGFEAFFWAPCDFIEFTPEDERFFSGQTAYPGTRTGTRNLLDACHEHGMVGTVYANLWGGSGPPVYEVMRRHPDWFGPVSFNTHVLDDWDLMKEGRIRAPGISHWCNASLRLNPSDDVFRLHAQELINSHREFGWDGVRYDSFYSAYWSNRAISVVRPMVEKAAPGFMFGYNSFATADHQGGALPLLVGGGGMIMAEGIRIERTDGYLPYASELQHWRDLVWPYGGHIGPLYPGAGPIGNPGQERPLTVLDQITYSNIILAVGAHPYYHPLESEAGQHQFFARRYSEYIYNNRMRPLKNPEQVVSFGGKANFFLWQPLTRTVTLDGPRRRLVLHLLNVAAEGKPSNLAMPRPSVIRNLPVTLALPSGAKVTSAHALKAFPFAHHQPVPVTKAGDAWTATVDEVLYYTMLVVEFESDDPLPQPITPKSLQDTYLQHWQVVGPFPNPGVEKQEGFEVAYGPEKGFDPAATYEGCDGEKVRWHPIREKGTSPLSWKLIDLREHFEKKDGVVAYALTKFTSDRVLEADLFASASDSLIVWLNGEQVFSKKDYVHEIALDMHKIPVRLKTGENTLLLKICQQWLSWGFYARLSDKDGKPLVEGMKYGME